jgi:hypothetical protein
MAAPSARCQRSPWRFFALSIRWRSLASRRLKAYLSAKNNGGAMACRKLIIGGNGGSGIRRKSASEKRRNSARKS